MTELEQEKENLLTEIKTDLATRGYFTKATCGTNSFGWKLVTHLAMQSLKRQAPEGMNITCKVNHEVTDWTVTIG